VRAARAVERVIPLMQSSQETWTEKRKCTSCHHQALGVMALVVARERGFRIDETRVAAQVRHARRAHLEQRRDEQLAGFGVINPQIGAAYTTLMMATVGEPPSATTDLAVHVLAGKQSRDGAWRSESHRPPLEDTDITATALAVRVLQLYAPPGRAAEMRERAARGVAWLRRARPRYTEDRTMQLLAMTWAGAPRADLAAALAAEQRADGGWAQLPSRPSDAYATGKALVALHLAGALSTTHPRYRRGVAYLLRTQARDGSWHVVTRRKLPGLPHFETGFPYGPDQFLSFAATAWSVMALAMAARPDQPTALLRSEPAAGRRTRPDILAIALTGTAADLRRAMAASPPDAATRDRLAFAAVRDRALLEVVLDAGASPGATLSGGETLLMAAAGYAGAAGSVELLLARGADPRASARSGHTALHRAAGAGGDIDRIAQLLAAGASFSSEGTDGSPLAWATSAWDLDAAAFLLDRGAQVNESFDGVTALGLAVIDREEPVVDLLLRRGADANAGGPEGTPLHFAALVDPGHGRIVERLLAAGADRTRKNAAGQTPLDIARAVRHRAAVRALSAAAPAPAGTGSRR
jgi:hypothetical protein